MNPNILDILKKITSLFAYSKDNKKILHKIVNILAEALSCEVCSIYAYDEKKNSLVLAATYGLNQDIVGKFSLKPGEGITGTAFSENQVINIAHPHRDSRFKAAKGSGEEKYNSIVSCPLVVGGRKFGVINLQSVRAETFDSDFVEVLKSLSVQIANIIESSKIFSYVSLEPESSRERGDSGLKEKILKGTPANQGLAIGRVLFLDRTDDLSQIVAESKLSHKDEIILLENAINAAKRETEEMGRRALKMITEADASIFGVHLLFLEDKTIIDKIKKHIHEGYSAEYSVKTVCDDYLGKFEKMDSEIFREKAADLKDVMIHLIKQIKKLKGHHESSKRLLPEKEKCIIAAYELLPSDILRIPASNVAGYISQKGAVTAHFAILARALNIPAMMGVKDLSELKEGDKIILDCYAGLIYINPPKDTEKSFVEILESRKEKVLQSDTAEARTTDGKRIYVRANLSLLSELPAIKQSGAEGIGLYRTEFAYMIRDYQPSEETLSSIYSKICGQYKGETISFRMLDIGSDKSLSYVGFQKEENPSLGMRGVRVISLNEELFITQIKAILSSAVSVNLRIIIPMVSNLDQIDYVRSLIEKAARSLDSEGKAYNKSYKIGIMIEIPSVVFELEKIIDHIDFASVGTNDLMQFFFAVDRTNEQLSSLLSYYDPSFLRLIRYIGEIFMENKKDLCVCGEMASDLRSVPLLIGSGVSELSINARMIPTIKALIRKLSHKKCTELLSACIKSKNVAESESICNEFIEKECKNNSNLIKS